MIALWALNNLLANTIFLHVGQFSWNPGTTGVPGWFTVKAGTVPGGPYPLTRVVPPPTTLPIDQVLSTPGTYYSIVTASNVIGESPVSNEVVYTVVATSS